LENVVRIFDHRGYVAIRPFLSVSSRIPRHGTSIGNLRFSTRCFQTSISRQQISLIGSGTLI
jgi:hypothetical protein